MLRFITATTLCFLLLSCEKELNIKPNNVSDLLAVDASIEAGGTPRVILTRSFKYFNTLSAADLAGAFVSGAKITVSDGTITQELKEYIIKSGQANIIIYSTDTALGVGQLFGKTNSRYQLTIQASGQTYTAATTIPDTARTVDSAWWKPAPGKDTAKVVMFATVTDPKGLGNYVRYFTSRNDSAFLPGLNSVFDDAVIDGTTYTTQVDGGVDRNRDIDLNEYGFFARGDTVKMKLSNIDKATYDFWRTWEQNQSNLGNPFSVPVKILGNISNGALGYFGGYASQVKTVIVPK